MKNITVPLTPSAKLQLRMTALPATCLIQLWITTDKDGLPVAWTLREVGKAEGIAGQLVDETDEMLDTNKSVVQ